MVSGTVEKLFKPLHDLKFSSRDEAEQAIANQFRLLRGEFDPDYSLYQLLKWSYDHNWIFLIEGTARFCISLRDEKKSVNVRELLIARNGQEFESYKELFEALRRLYLDNRQVFPTGYRLSQLLDWMHQSSWINQADGKLVINVR